MAEILTYTTPQYQTPAAATVEIVGLEMYLQPTPFVRVLLQDSTGRTFDASYQEDEVGTVRALILALNKANLATKSLYKRVMERLLTDGRLAAGTISGTPD